MDLRDRPEDEAFRHEVRAWLAEHVVGEFAALGGRGGSGDETFGFEIRLAVGEGAGRRRLDLHRVAGPSSGAAGASIAHQVIFNEEYVQGQGARAGEHPRGGPARARPSSSTGRREQQARFLPPILAGTELWCQGYSEPDAGSDLANVQTRAELDGDEWVVTGQKVWTSLAHQSDWCFVVCRTEPGSVRHKGLSYLLVPWISPASRSGRSPSSPGPPSSTRSSSTAPAPPRATWSGGRGTAGGWPSPPWPTNAGSASSATSSRSDASSTS